MKSGNNVVRKYGLGGGGRDQKGLHRCQMQSIIPKRRMRRLDWRGQTDVSPAASSAKFAPSAKSGVPRFIYRPDGSPQKTKPERHKTWTRRSNHAHRTAGQPAVKRKSAVEGRRHFKCAHNKNMATRRWLYRNLLWLNRNLHLEYGRHL